MQVLVHATLMTEFRVPPSRIGTRNTTLLVPTHKIRPTWLHVLAAHYLCNAMDLPKRY